MFRRKAGKTGSPQDGRFSKIFPDTDSPDFGVSQNGKFNFLIPDCISLKPILYKFNSLFFICNFILMNWKDYIITDKNILGGKPSLRNTRLSVEFILERLSDGWTEEMLFENYPSLTKEMLQAVYAFALDNIKDALLVDWAK
jgi:uncharacterized protein (DUF433 family)